ncbi:MAG: hypothetical protein KGZ58_05025 [Ignavibacteriales bacterium]|nr:hypothetical protein [Ignavibacteriales bacterium]
MNKRNNIIIVLIHGAILRTSTYKWLQELRNFLIEKGFINVHCFYWSGLVSKRAIRKAGKSLANLLLKLSENNENASYRIYVKSTGALVFRSALEEMKNSTTNISFDILLQVASPNPPKEAFISNSVNEVVNIYSRKDRFLRFFISVGLFYNHSLLFKPTNDCGFQNIEIEDLSHDEFNWNTLVRKGQFTGRRLYDIYFEILNNLGYEK